MNIFLYLKKLFLVPISRTDLIIRDFKLNRSLNYVWGMKHSGLYLRGKQGKSSPVYLEDGFIHSFGNSKSKIPFSICLDKKGIFYDFNSNSDLFKYLKDDLIKEEKLKAKKIIRLWKEYSISKYNFANFIEPPLEKYVLLIDQVFGDLSIYYGGATKDSFNKMFEFACKNWPNHKIVIKVHPDVINSKKYGCLDRDFYGRNNVILISTLGQINKLIEQSSAVCVVTSQVGFEALIYGKEVHVFGKPFYSGLGLTIDHRADKINKRDYSNFYTIEKLVFAVFIKYQIFLDPRTKKFCDIEEIIKYVYYLRKVSNFFPNDFKGINLTPWKARQINRFVYPIKNKGVSYFKRFNSKFKNIIVWGKNPKLDRKDSIVNNFISVEDGFVRSVGLGADLYPPLSLLFDKKGIHYDASKASDLEDLLNNRKLKKEELIRSKKLIYQLIKLKISKYNLRIKRKFRFPKEMQNRYVIAVLGQVETDNSILYGVPNNTIPKTNFALVKQVKKDYPNAYIIYKPHPDVESGLRVSISKESAINNIVDFISYNSSLDDLFNKVDRVAVFTSLGGYEALIRGIAVTTYGFPFYAGWGLTEDKLKNHKWAKRRTRVLTIEELTFISLIDYPLYSSVKYNCLTDIENILDEVISTNTKMNFEQIIFKYWGILKDFFLKKVKK